MVFYVDEITLLDRTNPTRTASTDLLQSADPSMTGDGDLRPWRVRLAMTNTGEDGVVNSGTIKLRIDEQKRFIQTEPVLVDEDAKTKYLIEVRIKQRNPAGGADLEGKIFRFQLGSPSIDVDKGVALLTISLQEIQFRVKEVVSSRELRFISPNTAFSSRIIDFNSDQAGTGVTLITTPTLNKLPTAPLLEYIPQSPKPIITLLDDIVSAISEATVTGGTFTDFYYDYDPNPTATLLVAVKADEIGRVSSGITIDPLSVDVVDAETEQSAVTDFVRYKNHVIARGAPDAGSLPTEHSRFSSNWLHAKIREEFNTSRTIDDREGNTFMYLKGETVKLTFDTTVITTDDGTPVNKVIRFFVAQNNVATSSTADPDQNTTDWLEDFIVYPSYDRFGRYFEGDIVYNDDSGTITFYVARNNIFQITLNSIRHYGQTPLPVIPSGAEWTALTAVIPTRTDTNFTPWFSYSPWTADIFDWEKNMVGLKSGSLPAGTNNTYVGFVPDWNMSKDVYEAQDFTDIYENLSVKWVQEINVNDVTAQLSPEEIYHGQRILVGDSPVAGGPNPTGLVKDFIASGKSGTAANRLAEYDEFENRWRFSRAPETGDTVINFDDGKVYQFNNLGGNEWDIAWEVERITTDNKGNPISPASPFHLVKDVYKTQGFEGTPSNAIEFRFIYDTELLQGTPPTGGDDDDRKALLARHNSRGAWMWFWNPFPRLPHDSVDIGDNFGANGALAGAVSGFTTLNIFNSVSDRLQSLRGWNNGLNTEDMGKISGISFKMKLGVFAQEVPQSNDNNHGELNPLTAVVGLANVPMNFWCIDDFDRIWFKKFTLRRNNQWDDVQIQFGDLNQANMYLPRWDELSSLLGIPLSFTNFALKQREYTGVAFDWRFVRGWGVFHNAGYDETGFYNGGIDEFWDVLAQYGEQIKFGLWNIGATVSNYFDSLGNPAGSPVINTNKQAPIAFAIHRQSTIAMDDLHYVKELVVNSDDGVVDNARTKVEFKPNIDDYVIGKVLARADRERLSFFPQFWTLRSIGDVRMRVGQSFLVKGDRIPDSPKSFIEWDNATSFAPETKRSFEGFSYQARIQTTIGDEPADFPEQWENLNKLACGEVTHIIDSTGYHMEVSGRRKFITTGEV